MSGTDIAYPPTSARHRLRGYLSGTLLRLRAYAPDTHSPVLTRICRVWSYALGTGDLVLTERMVLG
eukprot:890240-Rhodomonas_salina.2